MWTIHKYGIVGLAVMGLAVSSAGLAAQKPPDQAAAAAAKGKQAPILSSLEVQRLVASGQPADHANLSAHFAGLADRYLAQAKDHDRMATTFVGAKNRSLDADTRAHCQKLAKVDRESAATLHELALYHGQLANGVTAVSPGNASSFEAGEGARVPTVEEVNALIASATGASEHRILADYFTGVAKKYEGAEAEHVAMARAYQGTRVTMGPAHCERLAKLARQGAKEAYAAASLHLQAADQVR